jgi:hypothetical protein
VASGVFRPYTLVDVLGTMNQQNSDSQGNEAQNGLGDFVETDEQGTLADSAVVTHSVPPTWNAATWGTTIWS